MADFRIHFQKDLLPHLLVLLVFLFISFVYFSPLFEGKTLAQHDSIQAKAAAREIKAYNQQTGEWPMWTNTMFSGMPGYLIAASYPGSWTTKIGQLVNILLPEPVNLVVLCMTGFYILLMTLGYSPWLGALGGIGFGLCTYTFLGIEAGHISKTIAIGYVPPMLAGALLAFRGKYLLGGALFGLFLGLNLYGNHVQITYYAFLMLGLIGLNQLIIAIQSKTFRNLLLAVAALAAGAVLGAGSHASRLLTTNEYSAYSIRGKSELSQKEVNAEEKNAEGLDKAYAFQYSYGIGETFTLLIPGFQGSGKLGTNSETAKVLGQGGYSKAQLKQALSQLSSALYWGDLPFTGGPAYAGAIVCFLFVLGLFIVKDPLKWGLLASALLFILLSWGKNFEAFNYLMFDYFPLYNKFRAVTMTLIMAQVPLVLLAVMAVHQLSITPFNWQKLQRPILISLGLTAGPALIMALIGGNLFGFESQVDTQFGENSQPLVDALRQDRAGLLQGDAWRSFFFIILAAGVLIAYLLQRVNAQLMVGALALLLAFDLGFVNSRYFNADDFVSKKDYERQVSPTPAGQRILQDKDPHYRVFDGAHSTFSDATTSLFHKSVGGYHGAKMKRYQELIEQVINPQITRLYDTLNKHPGREAFQAVSSLNMLNAKYFIFGADAAQVLENPYALGNAWFVQKVEVVKNADQEMSRLKSPGFDPHRIALVDERFKAQLETAIQPDTTANIRLVSYKPHELVYESQAAGPQVALFSEVYYDNGLGWEAFIDDKPVPHFRANYILRGMSVPSGKHSIRFTFKPRSYATGETISLISSIVLMLYLGGAVFLALRKARS